MIYIQTEMYAIKRLGWFICIQLRSNRAHVCVSVYQIVIPIIKISILYSYSFSVKYWTLKIESVWITAFKTNKNVRTNDKNDEFYQFFINFIGKKCLKIFLWILLRSMERAQLLRHWITIASPVITCYWKERKTA